MAPIMDFIEDNNSSDLQHMLETVQLDTSDALNKHSSYSIGRLHQTLDQFTETKSSSDSLFSNILSIPQNFVEAI